MSYISLKKNVRNYVVSCGSLSVTSRLGGISWKQTNKKTPSTKRVGRKVWGLTVFLLCHQGEGLLHLFESIKQMQQIGVRLEGMNAFSCRQIADCMQKMCNQV